MSRETRIVQAFRKHYPKAECSLGHRSPLQLLVATILSAQCTDERVNIVTQSLFRKYRSAADYANAKLEELEQDVKSTGFYRNKAKNIQACCRIIETEYGGNAPADMDALVALPGIGRKTANVVLGTAFNMATGIVVDTHVGRISRRLGLSESKNPEIVERDLVEIVPKREWIAISHRMIQHGRRVCKARKPLCDECPLADLCPKIDVH